MKFEAFVNLRPIDWLVLIAWGMSPLGVYIIAAFSKVPVFSDFAPAIAPIVFLTLTIASFKSITRKLRVIDVCFSVVVAMVFVISMGTNVKVYLEPYTEVLFLTALPMFYVGLFTSIERLQSSMRIVSVLCIFTQLFYVFFFLQSSAISMVDLAEEQMYKSYQILPHVLFVTMSLLKKNNIIDLISTIVGLIMILSYGARGPIVCFLSFVLLYILLVSNMLKKRSYRIIVLIIGLLLMVFYDELLRFLLNGLASRGFNTRIVDLLLQEEFISGSSVDARGDYATLVINQISYNMEFGRGMAGDRFATGGSYCHNFALEILASFGVILGSAIIISLLVLFVRAFIKGDVYEKAFLSLLLCAGFLKLFMSGTYIEEPYFFFAIGYSINIIRNRLFTKKSIY